MAKEKKAGANRVLTVIGTIMCIILVPILVVNVTLIAKSFLNKDEVPNFGGVLPMIVLTDSMYPEIESGDLIICKTAKPESIKVGDVISFFDPAGNGTSTVTHRVIEVYNEDGKLFFRTRGDNNNADDKDPVPAEKLVGLYQSRIPGAGNVAMFMQSTAGLVVCVVLPIMLLVGWDLLRRRKYEKNKQGETDSLLAELEALRAEKASRENAAGSGSANGPTHS